MVSGRRGWISGWGALLVLLLSTVHRGQPLPARSPQAIVESARVVQDRGRERATLRWRLEVFGRQLSGEGAVVWSAERALLELHGPLGVVELRCLMDDERLAMAVPATRTQYVGDRAGWAVEMLTGDEASLLGWVAMALDRPLLPSSPPREVRDRGDRIEAVWDTPQTRFTLDRQGRVLGLERGDLQGGSVVEVRYLLIDPHGRPREVVIEDRSLSGRLSLTFDRWRPVPQEVEIPAPDEVPDGMQRRSLEQIGAGVWAALGLTDEAARPEP